MQIPTIQFLEQFPREINVNEEKLPSFQDTFGEQLSFEGASDLETIFTFVFSLLKDSNTRNVPRQL